VNLWRIAAETRAYKADDLGGMGAAKSPGRWNAANEPVVYCAPTLAMAVLETVAHVDGAGLPLDRFVVQVIVPDGLWARREEALDTKKLPAAWAAIPAGRASVDFGTQWLKSLRSPILLVPSAIVEEEAIALVNPRHPDCRKVEARVVRRFEYNRVLR